jgi:hypothetical protein
VPRSHPSSCGREHQLSNRMRGVREGMLLLVCSGNGPRSQDLWVSISTSVPSFQVFSLFFILSPNPYLLLVFPRSWLTHPSPRLPHTHLQSIAVSLLDWTRFQQRLPHRGPGYRGFTQTTWCHFRAGTRSITSILMSSRSTWAQI